jgi:hypothetical protein
MSDFDNTKKPRLQLVLAPPDLAGISMTVSTQLRYSMVNTTTPWMILPQQLVHGSYTFRNPLLCATTANKSTSIFLRKTLSMHG